MDHDYEADIHPANRSTQQRDSDGILHMSLRNHGFDGEQDLMDPYATPQNRQSLNYPDHHDDLHSSGDDIDQPTTADNTAHQSTNVNNIQPVSRKTKNAKPDLSINTSRQTNRASTKAKAAKANGSASSPNAIQVKKARRSSVPDRSPLQTLETKLGDISKGEKRARLEEAEAQARRKASVQGNGTVRAGISQRQSHTTDRQSSVSSSAADRQGTRKVSDGPLAGRRDLTKDHVRYPSTGSYRSSKGHDSLLTGGAAAAAVSAYQAGLRSGHSPSLPPDSSMERENINPRTYHESPIHRSNDNINGQPESSPREPETNGYSAQPTAPLTPGLQQDSSGYPPRESRTRRIKDKVKSKFEQPDPVPRSQVEIDHPAGSSYIRPPQTANAVNARNQVGFGTSSSEQATSSPTAKSKAHLRFSDIIYRNKQSTRQYQEPNFLDEFRHAKTARLAGPDLDLTPEQAEQAAWWEKSAKQTKQNRNSKIQSSTRASDASMLGGQSANGFTPALTLKCGPLLRFKGVQLGDQTEEIWRGSVMIVTEDDQSTYQEPPILRLFRQPKADSPKLDSSSPAGNMDDVLDDAVKISPTGKPLYPRLPSVLPREKDLSVIETNEGLFESHQQQHQEDPFVEPPNTPKDGEQLQRYREVPAIRLHAERGVTFWRFNIEVELGSEEMRVAYRINQGPAVGFWVPARGHSMNIMFHSCNGFSLSVNPDHFSGPDPLWRDVLVHHQQRPFHCMLGGGDQIYNDAAMVQTTHFQQWLAIKNPEHKHTAYFTAEMQEELEQFYLNRYAMWFSKGLFSVANAQIPMVNIWDDHDIIDGYGSYPNHFMSTSVFTGLGAVAFKYYMLFQHQSIPEETYKDEPSWLLGASRGPYINQLSRSVFMFLGRSTAFLGLDCRTERMRDEVLSQDSYDLIFDRCRDEIVAGETKHLIVLLGIPIAYPRLNLLENILTSRVMDPIKALGRTGMLGGFINKFDGGVEILDDLDDHWTAKHHKHERNWFIQELQELAAEKSVRITILGGDVHLAACGRFYSNPKLGIPKDQDHRYMPNIISSAIVNTPPPDLMSDVLNKRKKVHHLDKETDEDMIPMFPHDVNGHPRNNKHLLPRRNWCSIKEYIPSNTPPASILEETVKPKRSFSLTRSLSRNRGDRDPNRKSLLDRLSTRKAPPSSFRAPAVGDEPYSQSDGSAHISPNDSDRRFSFEHDAARQDLEAAVGQHDEGRGRSTLPRSNSFTRRPSTLSRKLSEKDPTGRGGQIDLQGGLDISIHCEIDQKDPSGRTIPYRLLVPALDYQDGFEGHRETAREKMSKLMSNLRRRSSQSHSEFRPVPYENTEIPGTPPHGLRAYGRPMTDDHRAYSQPTQNGHGNSTTTEGDTLQPSVDAQRDPHSLAMHTNEGVHDERAGIYEHESHTSAEGGSAEVYATPKLGPQRGHNDVRKSFEADSRLSDEEEPEGSRSPSPLPLSDHHEPPTPPPKDELRARDQPPTSSQPVSINGETVSRPHESSASKAEPRPVDAAEVQKQQSQPTYSEGSSIAHDPPPPSNIGSMPSSVQKQYSQFTPSYIEPPLLPASRDQLRVYRKHAIQPGAEVHRSVSGPTRAFASINPPARAVTVHQASMSLPAASFQHGHNNSTYPQSFQPLGSAPVDFIPSQKTIGNIQAYQPAQAAARLTSAQKHAQHRERDPYAAYLESPSDSQISNEHPHPQRRHDSKLARFFGPGDGYSSADEDQDRRYPPGARGGKYGFGNGQYQPTPKGYESENDYDREHNRTSRLGRLVRRVSESARNRTRSASRRHWG